MSWRIAIAYVLLMLMVLALLTFVLEHLVRQTYIDTLERGLAGQAHLIASIVDGEESGLESSLALAVLMLDVRDRFDTRVTIINESGVVIADTAGGAMVGRSLLDRPEVQAALTRGMGESERHSAATGDESYYVAVPIGPETQPVGVVRVAVPLTTIAHVQADLAEIVLLVAAVALLVEVVLAVVIAQHTTQPLLDVRTMARRLAAGDLNVQVPIPKGEEAAELAQDFNQMASRLRHLIQAVDTERQQLATILETMADGILIVDAADMVTRVNRSASQLVPVAVDTLPRRLAELPIGVPLAEAVQQVRHGTPSTPPRVLEELPTPEMRRSLRAVVTHLPSSTQGAALIVLQDLTELRRLEQARRAFLANVSHDLRTPLTAMQAMIDTLQDGALDDRDAAVDFLRRMDAEVQSLINLVNEFLELTRIESGQIRLTRIPLDLRVFLEAMRDRIVVQAQQHRIAVGLDVPAVLPPVLADAVQLERVLLNVLGNALTWTPPGGTITLAATATADQVVVQVRDTGTGIPAKDLPYIFDRFYKADQARASNGTGLGLAIAKQLIEYHGGTVAAVSSVGHGTTITITLPPIH